MKRIALVALLLAGLVLGLWTCPRSERTAPRAAAVDTDEVAPSAPVARIAPVPEERARQESGASSAGPVSPPEGSPPSMVSVPELRSLVPAASDAFHGLVVDGLSGLPIAGARAVIVGGNATFAPDELESAEIRAEATSDAQGSFELELPSNFGLLHLVAAGYGPCSTMFGQAFGEGRTRPERTVRIELLPAAELEFEVRDATGVSREGIRIGLTGTRDIETIGSVMMLSDGPSLRWSAETDATGVARFTEVLAETVLEWSVASEGRTITEHIALTAREHRRVRVVLGAGASVFGTVRDEHGQPLGELELWLARPRTGRRFERGQATVAETRSRADGSFEFTDVPYEHVLIGASPLQSSVPPTGEPLTIDAPRVQYDLDVRAGLCIAGRVSGAPGGREFSFVTAIGVEDGERVDETLDGANFRLGPLSPGVYLVHAEGLFVESAVVRVAAGSEDVELRAEVPFGLTVHVSGAEGPLTLATICLDHGMSGMSTFQNMARATTELSLPLGPMALMAETEDGRLAYLALPTGPARPREVTLVLEPAARVTLVHRAASGVGMLRLETRGGAFALSPFARAASEGLLAGASVTLLVPPGEFTVELLVDGRVAARESALLQPEERRRIELVPR